MTNEPKPDRQKRKLPPVSTASGGLMPGVNLEDGSLQEAEDLKYVERMKKGFEVTPPSPGRAGPPGGR